MVQPVGSVYLDTPLPSSRRPPVPRVSRARSTAATVLVAVGLTGLSLAALVGGMRLLLDPTPIATAFETTTEDQTARAEIEAEIARGIADNMIGNEVSEVAAAFGFDVNAESALVSVGMLENARIREELLELFIELHAWSLLDSDGARPDTGALTSAVRDVIERESPELATLVPDGTVLWPGAADVVPDLTGAAELLDRTLMSALLAILAIPLGAMVHPRHHLVAGWVGRWSLVFGLICGLAAIGFPYLGGAISGRTAIEIAIRSGAVRLIGPAGISGIVGIGFVSLAAVARRRERRRVLDEGAAAAFGHSEPPMWSSETSPTLDLGARGLVDVNHPLTNI